MNFKWLIVLLLIAGCIQANAQQPPADLATSVFRPHRFIGLGITPVSTTGIQTYSLEFGYTLTRKIQVFAGPKFFITEFDQYPLADNPFGSFFGGFTGVRAWWRGIPQKGWAYFSSVELHYSVQKIRNSSFNPSFERKILSPELGNGFGRFSPGGFFCQFHFNWGFQRAITGGIGGDVYGSLRLATGYRF